MAPSRDVARIEPDAPRPGSLAAPADASAEAAGGGHAALIADGSPADGDPAAVGAPFSNAAVIDAARTEFVVALYKSGGRLATSFAQHPFRWGVGLTLVLDLLLVPILFAIVGIHWGLGAGLAAGAAIQGAFHLIHAKRNDNLPSQKGEAHA